MGKKDGNIRLIFDCRVANALHRGPARTALATPGAFMGLSVPREAVGSQSFEDGFFMGSLDLVDSFYQFLYSQLCSFFLPG